MAASGAPRQPRRGPAPFASFDHDVSDESSPETKQTFQLPEIREDRSGRLSSETGEVSETSKAREVFKNGEVGESDIASRSREAEETLDVGARLQAPGAPRIDISRASSSSHHDSRDSSPELALFAGGAETTRGQLELGFREDGALELRSSTEELAFLQAPGEAKPAPRRHSRKDSQSSEVALLAVSGRTSRLSSVGSQCSAHSALSGFSHTSRISRLSVVSGTSRSSSPHKMLLETSFCGPRPIETDPEVCAAAVEEKLLEIAKMDGEHNIIPEASTPDTCDRREVFTEVTVEVRTTPTAPVSIVVPSSVSTNSNGTRSPDFDENKRQKETKNKAQVEKRKARSRERRESSIAKATGTSNHSKDVIRIKLKPDDEYDDDNEDTESECLPATGVEPRPKPDSLDLSAQVRRPAPTSSPTPSRRRTPSPSGIPVSRKSSFCSLFKSREMIASPESPSNVLRRKKSLNEGRSRSKSRDRSATPTSATKIKGSVLSLFKTPRKSVTSPSPSTRDSSPVVQPHRPMVCQHIDKQKQGEKLKYYEDSKDGIIHIPLRTPPDEKPSTSTNQNTTETTTTETELDLRLIEVTVQCEPERPSMSAPAHRPSAISSMAPKQLIENTNESFTVKKPVQRTVLPDGSIIIPLHSPTEKSIDFLSKPTIKADINKLDESETETFINKNEQEKKVKHLNEEVDIKETVQKKDLSESQSVKENHLKKKERIVFITHVGSTEQVFSTQLSITKTPSITSEISGSLPSFPDGDEVRPLSLRDTHITSEDSTLEREPSLSESVSPRDTFGEKGVSTEQARGVISPNEQPRDSSESEPSSETAAPQGGNEVERLGLVVQESFEEELPYVPTTLPQERSLALPMVPVRERGGVRVAGTQRPRPAPGPRGPAPPRAPPVPAPPAPPADKLCIRLPRRPRTASTPAPARSLQRTRTRSGSDGIEIETRAKQEWIDFEEVPERRKQPKRIQTLPAGGAGAVGAAGAVVFSYVEPDQCRCECHTLDSSQEDEETNNTPAIGPHQ